MQRGKGEILPIEIAKIRENTRIGDRIRVVVDYQQDDQRMKIPTWELMEVTGIYPHLVTLQGSPNKHGYRRRTSVTYTDMILGQSVREM